MRTHQNPQKSRSPWTSTETLELARLWHTMAALDALKRLGPGKGRVSKAALVRWFLAQPWATTGRSKQSVEMKLCNASAVGRDYSLEIGEPGLWELRGYVPMGNYAKDLEAAWLSFVPESWRDCSPQDIAKEAGAAFQHAETLLRELGK